MKKIFLFFGLATLLAFVSCKKDNPLTDLGEARDGYAAQLRVSTDNSTPAFGEMVLITAQTWQRDDQIQQVSFQETVVETFGLDIALQHGSTVVTKTDDVSYVTVIDSIQKKRTWYSVDQAQLNNYFVTLTNNYVIRAEYPYERAPGKYEENAGIIDELNESAFNGLKNMLAYTIRQADYEAMFPGAPSSHVNTTTGLLTNAGSEAFIANATPALIRGAIATVAKVGSYKVEIDVNVETSSGTIRSNTQTFESNF